MADRVREKQAELVGMIVQALRSDGIQNEHEIEELGRAAFEIVRLGVTITPPEENTTIGLIVASSYNTRGFAPDLRGGHSVKPGNMRLDMRRLLVAGAQTIRDLASVVKIPLLLPMTALTIWDRIWSLLNMPISESEAVTIWVMWMNCDDHHNVKDDSLLEKVNAELALHNRVTLTRPQLDVALSNLEHMECIQRSGTDHSLWWLREWVSVRYR